LLNAVNSSRIFCTAGESTVSCNQVPIVDYLPNSQDERRITPEGYVLLHNEECIMAAVSRCSLRHHHHAKSRNIAQKSSL